MVKKIIERDSDGENARWLSRVLSGVGDVFEVEV